jgi:adenylate cyclase
MTTWDEFEASGALDPRREHSATARALAEHLLANGFPAEELAELLNSPDAQDQLTSRVLRPGPRLNIDEVAARLGTTREQVDRIRTAGGMPAVDDERVFTDADVASMELFRLGAAVFGEEPVLQFVRVAGSSLARIAEAAVAVFWSRVLGPLTEQQATPDVKAKADLDATQLLAATAQVLDSTFRVHAEIAINRMERARQEAGSFDTGKLAVGFVDLVGFTSFSERLEPVRLAEVFDEFEGFAFDVVNEHDARLVKLIGDAAMFVALDVDDACEIALTLAEHFRDDANPVTPRGGLAFGEMLIRGGDYYGPVVNLASRASELAVPYEVLVTEPVVAAAGSAYRFQPAGRRSLKGFADPVLLASLTRQS